MADNKTTRNPAGEVSITVSADEQTKVRSHGDTCRQESLESSRSSPTKLPKIPTSNPTLSRSKSFARSVYIKPKSRFGQRPYSLDAIVLGEEEEEEEEEGTTAPNSQDHVINVKAPLILDPPNSLGEEEEMEIIKKVEGHKEKPGSLGIRVLLESVVFTSILGLLLATLTIPSLENVEIWSLQLWRWIVLVMALFSGILVTRWFMYLVVFMIEKNFLLRKKVLYFVHGLKESVQVFIWIALVQLTWVLLFRVNEVNRSITAKKVLDKVTWTIVAVQIAVFLWLVRTLLLKILASSFHMQKFFDRIQESIFHQYVLKTFSGPPLVAQADKFGSSTSGVGKFSFRSGKKGKKVIDMKKFLKMKREKVSAWTMKVLVEAVMTYGVASICTKTLDHGAYGEGCEADKEITNEMEAITAAYYTFRNIVHPGCCYIDEGDLLRFMEKEEVDLIFPLLEGEQMGKIDRKSLTKWVIKVYKDRRALAHALTDTKTAVKQLGKVVTAILIVISVLIWLLLMGIATTRVLVFLSSQLVVAAFIFGNTCKTIFEAIIFVFVMHPFDVGDLCVIDGVQLMVEEMNILTTVFLKLDNEKVYFPNSVLATKAISNYYRSPEMGETVDFDIGFATPVEKLGMLKDKINKYLEGNPQHWHRNHSLVAQDIEDINKIKMSLFCHHTMNFQEFEEKNKRRTGLVLELKRILEEVDIKYNLPPQCLHLDYESAGNRKMMIPADHPRHTNYICSCCRS